MGNLINKELNNISDTIKNWYEEIYTELMTKELDEYNKKFKLKLQMAWDELMLEPSTYNRTGRTRASMQTKDVIQLQDGKLVAKFYFEDSLVHQIENITHEKRNVFIAMNDGWDLRTTNKEAKSLNIYKYTHKNPTNIWENSIKELRDMLPDYIELEIIRK